MYQHHIYTCFHEEKRNHVYLITPLLKSCVIYENLVNNTEYFGITQTSIDIIKQPEKNHNLQISENYALQCRLLSPSFPLYIIKEHYIGHAMRKRVFSHVRIECINGEQMPG